MVGDGMPPMNPEARGPRWPAGFLGMLGLLLAVETGLTRGELGLGTVGAADWGLNRAEAVREGPGAEVLCFGDSLIKCGVAPAVLEARLDRTAYNLASLGATPPASYFLLKRALDAGARPRAILFDAKASTLNAANYWYTVRDWANLVGPWDALQLARDDRNPAFFGLHLVHYLIPSVRLRLDLRTRVVGQVSGAPPGPEISWGRSSSASTRSTAAGSTDLRAMRRPGPTRSRTGSCRSMKRSSATRRAGRPTRRTSSTSTSSSPWPLRERSPSSSSYPRSTPACRLVESGGGSTRPTSSS